MCEDKGSYGELYKFTVRAVLPPASGSYRVPPSLRSELPDDLGIGGKFANKGENSMTTKTLKTFVTSLVDAGFTPDGATDYQKVDQSAKEYFGHALPNEQVWKVVNHLGKPKKVAVVDDL